MNSSTLVPRREYSTYIHFQALVLSQLFGYAQAIVIAADSWESAAYLCALS